MHPYQKKTFFFIHSIIKYTYFRLWCRLSPLDNHTLSIQTRSKRKRRNDAFTALFVCLSALPCSNPFCNILKGNTVSAIFHFIAGRKLGRCHIVYVTFANYQKDEDVGMRQQEQITKRLFRNTKYFNLLT